MKVTYIDPLTGKLATKEAKESPPKSEVGPQITLAQKTRLNRWATYCFGEEAGKKIANKMLGHLSSEHTNRQIQLLGGLATGTHPYKRLAEQLGVELPKPKAVQ